MLKDIDILSSNPSGQAMVSAKQEDWEHFLKSLALVMIKAITTSGQWRVKIIFLHEKKKFKIEMEKAEGVIVLP